MLIVGEGLHFIVYFKDIMHPSNRRQLKKGALIIGIILLVLLLALGAIMITDS